VQLTGKISLEFDLAQVRFYNTVFRPLLKKPQYHLTNFTLNCTSLLKRFLVVQNLKIAESNEFIFSKLFV